MTHTDDRSLSFGVLAFVVAVHIAIPLALRYLNKPELPVEPPGLSFVDLGMMGGGEAGSGDGQTAPEPSETPPQPQPPEPPKPVPEPPKPEPPKPRETVKPVVRRDAIKPDVIVPPEQPKPEPQRPIEPIKPVQPQPVEKPINPTNTNTASNNPPSDKPVGRAGGNNQTGTGQGGNAAGSGGGSGGGQGDGGGGNGGAGGGDGGGDITLPSHTGGYLNNPKPPYPPQLLEEGVNGSVRLRVMVEANGKPSSVEVLSATHPLFRRSAEETVRNQYTFTPAKRGGQPIRHSYTFTIRFNAPR